MKIILCVTGSIAATEDLKLARQLQRQGFDVECFMTESATEIITPLSMEFATGNPVVTKLTGKIEHVRNAKADLILVAPATANTISKFANGIADTSVTTLLLTASGYRTPILFVPSMHLSMYTAIENVIEKIKMEHPEAHFLEPVNEENKAKFPNKHDIILEVERLLSDHKLRGVNVLVTAGGTFEAMDSMRGITNRSSGKMGIEIAKEAYRQGANVKLVCGSIHAHVPKILDRVDIESTREMMNIVKDNILETDVYVSAAAVADFEIDGVNEGKISSDEDIMVNFTKLPKILEEIKQKSPSTFLVGFKAEAGLSEEELIEKATNRMIKYNTDLMVANDILVENGGPGSDNNEVYLIDKNSCEKIDLTSKRIVAENIIDKVYKLI